MAHPRSEDRTGFVNATLELLASLASSAGALAALVFRLLQKRDDLLEKRVDLEQLLRAQGWEVEKKKRRKSGHRLAGASAWKLTDLAAIFAGRKRPALREEWRAHLTRGENRELSPWRKVGAALGFVVAALRYRLQDAAELAWIPADAVLRSRPLSNLVVLVPTAAAAAVLLRHNGVDGLLGSAESITAIGGLLYGLIRAGRWWRGVKPQEPKARGTKE